MLKTIKKDKWLEIGKILFGDDFKDWRFKCVRCGHVQSIRGALERNPKLTLKHIGALIYFSCEGRWNKSEGCDWTLGGLFQIHNIEVIDGEDERRVPVFEFDHPDAEKLISEAAGE